MKKKTVGIISLGCAKNQVDTEQMLFLLRQAGYTVVTEPAEAETLIVNTCGFIQPAKEESIDAIFEMASYKQAGSCKKLVVTGCLAQRYEKALAEEMPEVDLFFGVNQYDRLVEALESPNPARTCCAERFDFMESGRILTTPPYSAYVRIADGCSNRCAYCAIPLIRGPFRSRDEEAIVREVKTLAAQGVREHTLIAQDTSRYGMDRGGESKLGDLMERLAGIPGVDWLRVLYCYPDETKLPLLEAMCRHDNICRYLDLPLQHIDPDMLRAMNRRGTPEDVKQLLKTAREMGFALRTTMIVGFPGETEDQFKRLYDFVGETRFDRLGAFAYSPEEDTPGAEMPGQIPEEVKQERLDKLMTLQRGISRARNEERIGTVEKVLITSVREDGTCTGRSAWESPESDGEIIFTGSGEEGKFTAVRITGADDYDLEGEQL